MAKEQNPPPFWTTQPYPQFTNADAFEPQTDLDRHIASTLSDISHEQGRQAERTRTFGEKVDKLADKMDALILASHDATTTLASISPKVDKHNRLYYIVMGIGVCVMFAGASVGYVLYISNANRIDKLIKVLESPGIEKILKKD